MKRRNLIPASFLLLVIALAAVLFSDVPRLLSAPTVAMNRSFTYQGSLQSGGEPVNGSFDFRFTLYDAATGGAQQGPVITRNAVAVSESLFTVALDFGNVFDPLTQLYLDVAVRPAGSAAAFETITPRQALTSVPFANALVLPAEHTVVTSGSAFVIDNNGSGQAAEFRSNSTFATIYASNSGTGGTIRADTGSSGQGSAITAYNYGTAEFAGEFEVINSANSDSAVYARTAGSGQAIDAEVNSNTAADAIYARTTSNSPNSYAGVFSGNVTVVGNLSKSSGAFKIDHPLDPANKYLQHSFVESPDMKNIYDGIVTTDAAGLATVTMPDYFAALNRDFRYQLTVIGTFAQAIVKTELVDGSFTIQTDQPNVKVSWQVTGIRQDAYANENRIEVEVDKPAEERGTYLHPQVFGQPAEKALDRVERPLADPARPAP